MAKKQYLWALLKTRRYQLALGFVVVVVAGVMGLLSLNVNAATTLLVPDTDVAVTGWARAGTIDTSCAGGTLCDQVDEGQVNNLNDYIQTNTTNDLGAVTFGLTTVSSVDTATSISVYLIAKAAVVNRVTIDTLTVDLLINGVSVVTPAECTPGNVAWAACTLTFNGTWTQSDVDGMEIKIVRNILGTSGNTSSRADTTQVANIHGTLTYTQPTSFDQVGYRFFDNVNSTNVGAALAAQNTTAIVSENTPFRMRSLLNNTSAISATAADFKLQYKLQPSGSCTATGTYTDVTANSDIRYYDNPAPTDASALTSNVNDPVRSGVTKINQTYEEANIFSITGAIGAGQDGMWDFSLSSSPTINPGTYCLKVVKSSGLSLSANTTIAAVKFNYSPAKLDQSSYRLYQNADSTTPGTPRAGIGSVAELASANDPFRVRASLRSLEEFKFTQLSASESHTCGVASDGKAYCWGLNSSGQLGNGNTTASNVPVAVSTSGALSGKLIASIEAGGSHTCAVTTDNLAYCWGSNAFGQFGNGATGTTSNVPVAVSTGGALSGKTIVSISAGIEHTCAIASDNNAYCWGNGGSGRLGYGSSTASAVPVAVTTSGVLAGKTMLTVSAAFYHTCAVASDNKAYCWGEGIDGQMGNGSTNSVNNNPVAVDTSGVLAGKTVLSISSGQFNSCVNTADGNAYCWGYNDAGQLGNGTFNSVVNPSPSTVDRSGVMAGKTVKSLTVGIRHACAIASDDNAYCWGHNDFSSLGNGTTGTNLSTPSAVINTGALNGKTIKSITSYRYHTCVVASDNRSYCWGLNDVGQLGNSNTGTNSNVPVASIDPAPGGAIAANVIDVKAQFALKTQSTCSAQTGYADISAASTIAFNVNPSAAHGSVITSNANDPIATSLSNPQTYNSAFGSITNPNNIEAGKHGLWDLSLKANNATPGSSYCIRFASGQNVALGQYTAFPEVSIPAAGGATLEQKTRGGQSVVNGVKNPFSF